MKILVIFTGGTIGSVVSDGWISPDGSSKYLLIDKFLQNSDTAVDFDYKMPYTLLSENLSARELNLLVDCIRENLGAGYDGIIVTHGTDSIQFSAAAVSLCFCDADIPIVFVSSNHVLTDLRANGLDNFIAAVNFIKEKQGGIFVSYKNRGKRVNIHLADRISTHGEMTDELFSVDGEPYGFYEDGKITIPGDSRNYPSVKEYEPIVFSDSSEICLITAFPGNDFAYDLSKYKAVLICPYHSGTFCTSNESFIKFCRKAQNADIPIFLCNYPVGETYETSKKYCEMGIIPLVSASFASSYISLWAFHNRPDFAEIIKSRFKVLE